MTRSSGRGVLSATEYAGICVHENAVATTLAAQDTHYQATVFDTNDPANGATPDHSNDHITVLTTGIYYISCSIQFQADQANADTYVFHVSKNNNDAEFENLHGKRSTAATGRIASVTISGIASLTAGDTIELWVHRTTSAGNSRNITITNVSLSMFCLGNA